MSTAVATTHPSQTVAGKRRFAVTITLFTILGHAWLGFEPSYAQPLVALAVAYGTQLLLECVDARAYGRRPRYAGGLVPFVDFLTSAHIAALSIAMLLYFNDRLVILAFAVATAIASKYVLRLPQAGGLKHFFNPSNLGITTTLLLFPSVGLAMPWQFAESFAGIGDWVFLLVIICLGSMLNFCVTKRVPAIMAFLVWFVLQAVIRSIWFGTPVLPPLLPATGVVAWIFIFYMLPDPATSPSDTRPQILFGSAVAILYGILVANHIVFALFYALTIVCGFRGALLLLAALRAVPNAAVDVSSNVETVPASP